MNRAISRVMVKADLRSCFNLYLAKIATEVTDVFLFRLKEQVSTIF